MPDRLLELLMKLAIKALDLWLDARIRAAAWPAMTKERIEALEDQLVRKLDQFAETDAAKKLVRGVAKLVMKAKFPNDPSTGTWAG